ncbi:MAG: hypothetical protein K6G00_04075 [Treponema sp.]|nr:hypothetical protein [Treponema sp.]
MDYLYFGIIIIISLFISLYFYKKNKNNSNVYIIQNNNEKNEENEVQKESADEDNSENTNSSIFDDYKMEIIYYWMTQKVLPNKNIDYEILKEKIIKTIGSLPEVLEDNTTFINTDQEEFLKEITGRVDFSSPLKFFIVNKGRKLFSILRSLLILSGVVLFILFKIEIRKEQNNPNFIYLIFSVISFVLSFIFRKFSDKFLSLIKMSLKPGDYLKIISEPDELIEKNVKINQLSKNETMFNKTTVFLSKKKLLLEDFLSHSSEMLNTINNKLCLYIVIDYLKNIYSKEAYREYLLEKEIDVLEFICGFNQKSVSVNFELALLYFQSNRFDDFYETLLKCRNINGYDWIIESYIKSYEFYKNNCGDK